MEKQRNNAIVYLARFVVKLYLFYLEFYLVMDVVSLC